MIRLCSIEKALFLRETIPKLAIIRAIQFMDDGYSPEEHGHIIVLEEGDDINQIKEIGPNGLYDDNNLPTFEFIGAFVDGDQVTYELVNQIDDERTVAVIIPDEPWLDPQLREILKKETSPLQPLPTLEGGQHAVL